MAGFLKFLRWFVAIPLLFILFIVTTIAIPTSSFASNISNRNRIKSWIKEAGIYENFENIVFDFIDSQAESSSTDAEQPESEGSSGESGQGFAELKAQIQDPNSEMGKLVNEIITPEFLEKNTNVIIDAFYDFLARKTQRPTFKIVITEDKEVMVSIFALGFKEKVKNLPECDATFVPPPDFDPINTTCRPKDYDLNQIDTYISTNIDNETLNTLMSHAVIDSETIKFESQSLANAQKVYSVVSFIPLIAFAVIVFLSMLLILIIPNFKTSFRVVGVIVGAVSLALFVVGILGLLYYNNIHESFYPLMPAEVRPMYDSYFRLAVRNVYDDLTKTHILFSVFGFMYGLILIGISYIFKKKEEGKEKAH